MSGYVRCERKSHCAGFGEHIHVCRWDESHVVTIGYIISGAWTPAEARALALQLLAAAEDAERRGTTPCLPESTPLL